MSRKNKPAVSPAVSEVEAPATAVLDTLETIEAPTAAPEESAPAIEAVPETPKVSFKPIEKKAPGFAPAKERDRFGFAVGSYTSRIAGLLSTEEGFPRRDLLAAALDVTEDSGENVRRARKTTLSVFLSDSRKTPGIAGSYPVSRGFVFEEDESGNLRISPETRDRAISAVAGGLLSELKEARTESARKAIVSRFGFEV